MVNRIPHDESYITSEEVTEVLIGGRWIKVDAGSYQECGSDHVYFTSAGRLYNTTGEHIQVKVEGGK